MPRQYVIVGASAAGIAAAERLRELDPGGVVTVVGDEPHYAYYRPLLPYLVDGRKTLADISFQPERWYAEKRIRLVLGVAGHRIETGRRVVESEDGRRFDYDALLLAVGAAGRLPDTPGIDTPGVYALRTVSDAGGIAAYARSALGKSSAIAHAPGNGGGGGSRSDGSDPGSARSGAGWADAPRRAAAGDGTAHAVLLGAGLVSLKAAEPLMNLGVRCTFVVASAHPLSRVVDAAVGAMVAARLRARGARLLFGREVAAVTPKDDGHVGAVVLDTGESLACDLVVVGKGVAPNVEAARRSELACHWGVRADSYLETTAPGVFAAGDCVETTDVVTGGLQVAALWTNAVSMAHVAAHNMVHGPDPERMRRFPGVIGTMNSGVIAGLPIVALGLTDPVGDRYETVAVRSGAAGPEGRDRAGDGRPYRKLVFDGDRLVGAVFAGAVDRAGVYRAFIETGLPLGPTVRAAAEEGRLTYADVQSGGRRPAHGNYVRA